MLKYLEKRKIWLIYIPLTIYWVMLFTATSLPAYNLPSLGFYDKLNHLSAYTILSLLLNLTLIYQRKSKILFEKASVASILIASTYGALDEIHQMFVPGRFAELLDWIADFSGAVIGVLFISFLMKKLNYKPEFR